MGVGEAMDGSPPGTDGEEGTLWTLFTRGVEVPVMTMTDQDREMEEEEGEVTAEHGVSGEGLHAADGSIHTGAERAILTGKVQPVELTPPPTSHPPPPPPGLLGGVMSSHSKAPSGAPSSLRARPLLLPSITSRQLGVPGNHSLERGLGRDSDPRPARGEGQRRAANRSRRKPGQRGAWPAS